MSVGLMLLICQTSEPQLEHWLLAWPPASVDSNYLS